MTPATAAITATSVELASGSVVILDGVEWTVEQAEPQFGRVLLAAGDGKRRQVSIGFLDYSFYTLPVDVAYRQWKESLGPPSTDLSQHDFAQAWATLDRAHRSTLIVLFLAA